MTSPISTWPVSSQWEFSSPFSDGTQAKILKDVTPLSLPRSPGETVRQPTQTDTSRQHYSNINDLMCTGNFLRPQCEALCPPSCVQAYPKQPKRQALSTSPPSSPLPHHTHRGGNWGLGKWSRLLKDRVWDSVRLSPEPEPVTTVVFAYVKILLDRVWGPNKKRGNYGWQHVLQNWNLLRQ